MKYSNEELLSMYKTMLLGRLYCFTIEKMAIEGKIIGMHHLGYGQEAISTAVRHTLTEDDWWIPQQRDHAGMLYKADLKKFMAEQAGKVTGYAQGIAFDMHMTIPETHMLFNNGTMGHNYGYAVGFAHKLKLDGKKQVIVTGLGEGSFQEGLVYEAFGLATSIKEPVVFILENNGWAISYDANNYPGNLADRAAAFGMPAVTVDGNDLLAMKEAVENAVALARENQPSLIECKTFRWRGHFVGEPAHVYRKKEEMKAAEESKNDPIARYEQILFNQNILTEELKVEIKAKLQADLDEAVKFAIESPFPGRDVVLDRNKVYANPWKEE